MIEQRYTLGYSDKTGEYWTELFSDIDLESVKEVKARLSMHQYDRPNPIKIRKVTTITTFEIVE